MHAMHMRAVEHTIRRGFCTHHAAWVNHTENRCKEDRCRGKETLIEAIGRALGTVLTEDVRGFLAHCGYRVPAQQL